MQVTEWDEPQAVIGSYLHRYAYPDWFARAREARPAAADAGQRHDARPGRLPAAARRVPLRRRGRRGMRVYDVASIANKGVSQRIITAPFSPLGQDTHVASRNATCVALPTNQPIHPAAQPGRADARREPGAAVPSDLQLRAVTDAEEGLILVDVNTLADGEPRNNFLKRALTWNPDGVLTARVTSRSAATSSTSPRRRGLVVVSLDDPLKPQLVAERAAARTRARARCSSATCSSPMRDGLKAVDVTDPERRASCRTRRSRSRDAQRIYVARTYAYVAAGRTGPRDRRRRAAGSDAGARPLQRRRRAAATRATSSSPRPTPRCSPTSPTAATD